MKRNVKYILFAVLGIGILLLACKSSTKLPNAFDQRVAENNSIGQIKQLVTEPQKTDFYGIEPITGASEYLYLGNYKGLTSWILLRYGFRNMPVPDSSKIESVQLSLYPSAAVGDSTAQFQATVHMMGSKNFKWDELEMKWSNFALDYLPTPLSNEPVDINTVAGETINFDLDIQQFTTPDSVLDSTIIENGICIRFDANQNVEMFKRFYSCDATTTTLKPTLKIISRHNGVADTTYDYYAHDAFVVRSQALAADSSQFLYTGRGYSYRSLLDFDVSEIPENATINRAQLKLILSDENSIYGLDPDLNVRLYPITAWPAAPADVSIDSSSTGFTSTSIEDTVTVEIRGQIQKWTAKMEPNSGLFIRALNEGHDITRLVFHGLAADDSLLRPKLIVDYTVPPKSEY